MLRWPVLPVFALAAMAQGDPREKPGDYPATTALASYSLGAEYLGRTLFSAGKAYEAGDFLVVDTAIYPARGAAVPVKISQFALRLNGRKELIYAQPAGMVATAMRLQPWNENRRRLVTQAGPLILGAPVPNERFPGDRQGQPRLPAPPRAPEPDHQANVEREPARPMADILEAEALPEIAAEKPLRGYLYFPYSGKLAKLKSIELVVIDEKNPGSAVLKQAR